MMVKRANIPDFSGPMYCYLVYSLYSGFILSNYDFFIFSENVLLSKSVYSPEILQTIKVNDIVPGGERK